MDGIENRKTRLDFVWRLLSVSVVVLGAIIGYFGQGFIEFQNAGEAIFIGVEALCALLLLCGIKYLYKDTKTLRDDDNRQYQKDKESIDKSYDDIFAAAKIGVIYLAIYSSCIAIYYSEEVQLLNFFIPTQRHLLIAAIVSIVLSLIPPNEVWGFFSKKICAENEALHGQNNIDYCKTIQIQTNRLKSLRWMFYSAFLFDLFYLASFAAGGA